ncbi:MAG: hypothetical protein JNK64_01795 [Myxococcales bacterium]|nr:hypothetical protein [Myxococcales bacterium]
MFALSLSCSFGCNGVDAPLGVDAAVAPDASADAQPPADAGPLTSSVVDSFPGTRNPNGVWTYGFAAATDAVLTPFLHVENGPGTPTWTDESPYVGGAHGVVWKNDSGGALFGVEPGQVSAHPGATGEFAVIRYTAPFTGSFTAHVEALAGDAGATSAEVRVRDVARHQADTPMSHDLPATELTAGDTIELWIGALGEWSGDNTPIVMTVSGSPR